MNNIDTDRFYHLLKQKMKLDIISTVALIVLGVLLIIKW